MLAVRLVHRVRAQGGRVTGFRSLCGGLPAPKPPTTRSATRSRGARAAWYSPAAGPRAFSRTASSCPSRGSRSSITRRRWRSPASVGSSACRTGTRSATSRRTAWKRWTRCSERTRCAGRVGLRRGPRSVASASSTMRRARTRRYNLRRGDAPRRARLRDGESPRIAVARALALPDNAAILDRLEWLGLFAEDPVPKRRAHAHGPRWSTAWRSG